MMNSQGRAIEVVDEAIDAARRTGDPILLAEALNAKGFASVVTGRLPDARAVSEESLALTTGMPASRLTGQTHDLAAYVAWAEHGDAVARPIFDAVIAELRSIQADGLANWFLVTGSSSFTPRDDPDRAIAGFRDVLTRIRPTEMFSGLSTGSAAMGLMYQLVTRAAPGDLEEAMSVARTYQKVTGRGLIYGFLAVLAHIAAKSGRPREAARILGKAEHLRAAVGSEFFLAVQGFQEVLGLLRAEMPEDELTALRAEGANLSVDEALRLAALDALPAAVLANVRSGSIADAASWPRSGHSPQLLTEDQLSLAL